MTPADIPPDRKHLAAMLRVHAHSAVLFGIASRRELIDYLAIAEDTIEQQAALLCADMDEFGKQVTHSRNLMADIERLRNENASLRDLVEAALQAGQQDDGEAISIIRAALEGTS